MEDAELRHEITFMASDACMEALNAASKFVPPEMVTSNYNECMNMFLLAGLKYFIGFSQERIFGAYGKKSDREFIIWLSNQCDKHEYGQHDKDFDEEISILKRMFSQNADEDNFESGDALIDMIREKKERLNVV